jgi:LacI family transcriptional regulator
MDDLSRFCCLYSECPDYGKRGAGNLTVPHRYGPEKSRRMLRCLTCKARFSERKGTPPVRCPASPGDDRIGVGARRRGLWRAADRTALPGRPNTVARYSQIAGEHAKAAHDELVGLFPPERPRSSSMRSGRSSPRRRRTATGAIRPTTTRGITGTTSPWTPSTGSSSPSCPAPGRSRIPRGWSRCSADGRAGG